MDFNFKEDDYKVSKSDISTSGCLKGHITRCEYDSRYDSIGIDIEGENEQVRFLSLGLTKRDSSDKAPGYYQFMALCLLLGISNPKSNENGVYIEIIGKEIVAGVKLKFTAGQKFPKKYLQFFCDPKTGQTYTEKRENKPAVRCKEPIKDEYDMSETTTKQDFAPPADEPPMGFGGGFVNTGTVPANTAPAQAQIPLDEDLPF